VKCGSKQDYSRFFIIPTLYRTHLPDEMKSHRSHDIVLMCFGCHDLASRKQDKLKLELADKYNVPLTENTPNKQKNILISQLNRCACTLIKAGDKIPNDKS
jgi:hypothetical protein